MDRQLIINRAFKFKQIKFVPKFCISLTLSLPLGENTQSVNAPLCLPLNGHLRPGNSVSFSVPALSAFKLDYISC